ncbi:MAG: DUF6261 family protein [Tannerellaceae bacterium]|jgi:hypothetical protein|nr:DUF6261 family protein [Tannerellaceae bacterium]
MRILKLNMRRLRNEEWYGVYAELRGLAPVYGAAALGIADLLTLMEPLHDKADQLLEIVRKSTHTDELEEAYKARNAVFRGLSDMVKGLRKASTGADKSAADHLYVLLDNYRKTVLNGSYAEGSFALLNLLQDLQGKYAADVTLLGLGKWVTNLSAAEQKFVECRSARDKEYTEKPTEHLSNIRPQVDALYRSMVEAIYTKLVVAGLGGDVEISPDDLKTGPYEDSVPQEQRGNIAYNFVVAWNVVLKRYHNMLAARIGRKENDPETETDDDDESDLPVEG